MLHPVGSAPLVVAAFDVADAPIAYAASAVLVIYSAVVDIIAPASSIIALTDVNCVVSDVDVDASGANEKKNIEIQIDR